MDVHGDFLARGKPTRAEQLLDKSKRGQTCRKYESERDWGEQDWGERVSSPGQRRWQLHHGAQSMRVPSNHS